MSHGSWANFPELLRCDAAFGGKLAALSTNPALLDTGLFDAAGIAAVIDQHRDGRANNTKLLLQLLTVASWLEQHNYDRAVDDE